MKPRFWLVSWSLSLACGAPDNDYLPANPYGDFWNCPPIVTREQAEPSLEVLQSLRDFGPTWSGVFSLSVEGSEEVVEVPAEVRFDIATIETAGRVVPEGKECSGSVAVMFVQRLAVEPIGSGDSVADGRSLKKSLARGATTGDPPASGSANGGGIFGGPS